MLLQDNLRRNSLWLVLAMTAALWCGVAGIGLNADDYQYIASLAPMHALADLVRPFVSADANPSYFRPLANMTMVADFLAFGWNGGAYHLTNLFFHLVCTALLFFLAREVFSLRDREAWLAALLFGVLASHEYNLTVDTARADLLCTMFVMLALLFEQRAQTRTQWRVVGIISFALALLSKESALAALPLIPFIAYLHRGVDTRPAKRIAIAFLPYAVLSVLFYFYHASFVNQPSEVLHSNVSVSGGLLNAGFAIVYTLLPVDVSTVNTLMTDYWAPAIVIGGVVFIAMMYAVIQSLDRAALRDLFAPALYLIVTGSILCFQFERWRLYMPSVGLILIVSVCVSRTRLTMRVILSVLLAVLIGFHAYRAIMVQAEWRAGTTLLEALKQNLEATMKEQPHLSALGMLASPAKLGSAGVLQIGRGALVRRAEANVLSTQNRANGTTLGTHLGTWTAVDVFALHASPGFRGLTTTMMDPQTYLISVPDSSGLQLFPTALGEGQSWRTMSMHDGDTIAAPEFTDIVRHVARGAAKQIEVDVHDTAATILTFDGIDAFRILHTP